MARLIPRLKSRDVIDDGPFTGPWPDHQACPFCRAHGTDFVWHADMEESARLVHASKHKAENWSWIIDCMKVAKRESNENHHARMRECDAAIAQAERWMAEAEA